MACRKVEPLSQKIAGRHIGDGPIVLASCPSLDGGLKFVDSYWSADRAISTKTQTPFLCTPCCHLRARSISARRAFSLTENADWPNLRLEQRDLPIAW